VTRKHVIYIIAGGLMTLAPMMAGCSDSPQRAIDKQADQAVRQANQLLVRYAYSHAAWDRFLEDVFLSEEQLQQLATHEQPINASRIIQQQRQIQQITAEQAKLLDRAIRVLTEAVNASKGQASGRNHPTANAMLGAVLTYRARSLTGRAYARSSELKQLGYALGNLADEITSTRQQYEQLARIDFRKSAAEFQTDIDRVREQLDQRQTFVKLLEQLAERMKQQQDSLSQEAARLNRQIGQMNTQAARLSATEALSIYQSAADLHRQVWKLERRIDELQSGPYSLPPEWRLPDGFDVPDTVMGMEGVQRLINLTRIQVDGLERSLKIAQAALDRANADRQLADQRLDETETRLGQLQQQIAAKRMAWSERADEVEELLADALADLTRADKHLQWATRAHSTRISQARQAKGKLSPGQQDAFLDMVLARQDLSVGLDHLAAGAKFLRALIEHRRAAEAARAAALIEKLGPLAQDLPTAEELQQRQSESQQVSIAAITSAVETYEKIFQRLSGDQKALVAGHLAACYLLRAQIQPEQADQDLAAASQTLQAGLENQPQASRYTEAVKNMQRLLAGP